MILAVPLALLGLTIGYFEYRRFQSRGVRRLWLTGSMGARLLAAPR
jgi:hypothetical protein